MLFFEKGYHLRVAQSNSKLRELSNRKRFQQNKLLTHTEYLQISIGIFCILLVFFFTVSEAQMKKEERQQCS
ncbi:hypothetical protein T03_5789 [Trichinella britovi]|uniref:Uncharacterized protein n=1 Tax=Trichinella britovi TaxID=45882 RepID=A0A0V1C5T8_TRIBR|nr:hypothetical protein T03_5789 [Trichinella britovi]